MLAKHLYYLFQMFMLKDCCRPFMLMFRLADETTKIAMTWQLHILEDLKPYDNFENKVIVDIIKSRWQNVLSDYFYLIDAEKGKGEKREKEKVEFVCSDLYEPYRSIIATYFKNATYLVDHFHVVKLVNDQLNNTRKREMRKHSYARQSKEYRLLKFRYKLLMQYGPTVDIETYRFDSILGATVSIKPCWRRFFPSVMI